MNTFGYMRANSLSEAVRQAARDANAKFIAGGTNLIDLMKENVERPTRLIDISRLPLADIEETEAGGLRIGALVANNDVAYDARVEARYPLLSSAILAGASVQLRNMASTGGNLMQRTRCSYFYDTATPCNKREPGTGCSAIAGRNRNHAIIGASESCIATHPSDMCVALAALDASVHVMGEGGQRTIKILDFHRLPGDAPERDTTLEPGEMVTAVELPPEGFARHYTYLKLRDSASYAFALVSVATGLRMDGDIIADARVALGGIAHKPWRVPESEALLKGKPATREAFAEAAALMLHGARGYGDNDFKIPLAKRAVVRALMQAAAGTPQPQALKSILPGVAQ